MPLTKSVFLKNFAKHATRYMQSRTLHPHSSTIAAKHDLERKAGCNLSPDLHVMTFDKATESAQMKEKRLRSEGQAKVSI